MEHQAEWGWYQHWEMKGSECFRLLKYSPRTVSSSSYPCSAGSSASHFSFPDASHFRLGAGLGHLHSWCHLVLTKPSEAGDTITPIPQIKKMRFKEKSALPNTPQLRSSRARIWVQVYLTPKSSLLGSFWGLTLGQTQSWPWRFKEDSKEVCALKEHISGRGKTPGPETILYAVWAPW